MKRIWQHPEQQDTGRRYWRSIGELEQRASFLKNHGREFPNGDELSDEERENSRRSFLKIMGASVGMMGLASCRRPLANIVPMTKSVEWMVPGQALYYTTVMPRPYGASPMIVTTFEGRPTHLTSNSLHPTIGGGLDSFAQASILDLYDPDRSQSILIGGQKADAAALDKHLALIKAEAAKNGGEGIAILVGAETSPTVARLRGEVLSKFPKTKLYSYEAINRDTQVVVNKAMLGAGVRPVVRLDKAMCILSLDCDFLGLDPVGDNSVSEFSKNRNADKPSEADKMNRLYAIENRYTLTGAMADHRKPLAASLLPAAAALLAAKIDPSLAGSVSALAANASPDLKAWVEVAAEDLLKNKGKAVVLAGSRTSEAVQAIAVAINNALGAYGSVIETFKDEASAAGSLTDLATAIKAGFVKSVLSFTAADPAYDAPASLEFAKLVQEKKVNVLHLGSRVNATARLATLHIPAAHFLEAWGDVVSQDGVYSVQQPMIQPLFNGVSELEIYLALLDQKKFGPAEAAKPAAGAAPAPAAAPAEDPAYAAVRATFAKVAGGMSEEKWNFTLRDGFLKGSKGVAATATVNASALAGLVAKTKPAAAPTTTSLEVVLVPDSTIYDGRFVNNAWLQEAPDPITKITWDNAALIGSKTFRDLGLSWSEGDDGRVNDKSTMEGYVQLIEIEINGTKLKLPAIEAPGHVSNSITIALGYGQEHPGNVGEGTGFNAYKLLANAGEFVLSGAKVTVLNERYQLAITQEHNSMEGRSVYREGKAGDSDDFAKHTGIDSHIPPSMSFYNGQFGEKTEDNKEGFDFKNKHQWGMTIDLSKCIGCTACLIACQSENNIPVVGKDQVQKGRVMHWIRMDRYFATPTVGKDNLKRDDVDAAPTPEQLENAEMVHQPVACQQCEAAPCETVCPVNATVHTEEGLNAMAYNRCIGTRYCANNCPYTARRFNWFDYNKRPLDELYWGPLSTPEKTGMKEITKLQKNPNVTVRMRGVIEKCTYCVQRIETAKITQIQKQRDSKDFRVPTDSVKSACQQACPAGAIEFGDIADENSKVAQIKKKSFRNYEALKYLNTRPRTSYLARLRNVNPKMPGAEGIAAWSKNQF